MFNLHSRTGRDSNSFRCHQAAERVPNNSGTRSGYHTANDSISRFTFPTIHCQAPGNLPRNLSDSPETGLLQAGRRHQRKIRSVQRQYNAPLLTFHFTTTITKLSKQITLTISAAFQRSSAMPGPAAIRYHPDESPSNITL